MNYTPYSSNKKGNSVFYIIIIIALALIAIVAFIGLSNMNKDDMTDKPKNNISDNLENSQNNSGEYNSNDSSYNNSDNNSSNIISDIIPDTPKDNMPNITPSTPTNDDVKNEPYQKSYTMPISGDILKDFSDTALQFSQTYGDMRLHPAVDIACKEGTLIGALTNGKVTSVEESATLGNVITIDHGDGLIVKYAAIKDSKVKAGDTVKSGDLIGALGTIPCECSDQSHLHIEATENGKPISVLKFFN